MKNFFLSLCVSSLILSLPTNAIFSKEIQGITNYHLRLDHQFTNNRSHTARITMVPAEISFKAEKFSLIHVLGRIHAEPQSSDQALEMLAKKNAFIQILEQHGLCSTSTHNHQTMVSYEGVVKSPVNISISNDAQDLGSFLYSAQIHFAPLAFPDQWERLETRYRFKQLLNDFIFFFK